MGPLGWPEIIGIVLLAFLLFGPRKLPELARSLGEGIREFKRSVASGAADETSGVPRGEAVKNAPASDGREDAR